MLNGSCVLLFQSNLPTWLWSFVVKYVTHIIQILATPFLKFKSPYELVHGHVPILNHLRAFGCLAYATNIIVGRTNLHKCASKTIFVGFKLGTKGYVLFDIINKSCLISYNVMFYENHFHIIHIIYKIPTSAMLIMLRLTILSTWKIPLFIPFMITQISLYIIMNLTLLQKTWNLFHMILIRSFSLLQEFPTNPRSRLHT